MAHSFWSLPSFILLIWAAQRVRNVPNVVRRPPATTPTALDDSLDRFSATFRIFLLCKYTLQVCMHLLICTRAVLWEGCLTSMVRGCS